MADKTELVEQIKGIQRSDADAKQAWWDYCDSNLGGVKDPNRHDVDVLQQFLSAYSSGSITATARKPAARSGGGGGGGYGPGQAAYWMQPAAGMFYGGGGGGAFMQGSSWGGGLAEFIKTGQRQSQNWKTAWQSYCALNGTGFFDPAKYDDQFIIGFIDYVGNLAAQEFGTQAQDRGIDVEAMRSAGGKRAMPTAGAGGPPAKRAATSGAYPVVEDDEKAQLVAKIKELQRGNPDAKQAWWSYCDETLGGVKDPNRHDKETLQQFLFNFS